ncbi:MAG: MerR family transcriptional regulator [Deltaproteobacteria bacterium]|nr:MerR family transcriptional regulator [Deltaproteobacteria bacterium]
MVSEEYFTISAVARQFDVHPQTLRVYEREGLIHPQRSPGNTRLYSRRDIQRLRTILNLTREMGVNLAGVEVILRLKEQVEALEQTQEEILRFVMEELQPIKGKRDALVRIRTGQLWRKQS